MHNSFLVLCIVLPVCFALYSDTLGQQSIKGITEPYHFSTISATVPGRIVSVMQKEGNFVKKGEIILELEKEEEELEVALRKIIAESKIEIQNAEYQVKTLKHDYDATKQLFDSTRSVSEEELWKKDIELKRAMAEFDQLSLMEKKEMLEYGISLAELRKRIITAPFDGVVVKLFMKPGESCNAQEPLVRLVDVAKCRFITHILVATSQGLRSGMKVTLILDGSERPISCKGTVEFVSPVVDPSSGLREIRVVFSNPGGKIQPGITGSMIVGDQTHE